MLQENVSFEEFQLDWYKLIQICYSNAEMPEIATDEIKFLYELK